MKTGMGVRVRVALRAGAAAARLARWCGFGGAVIRGRVALLLHHDILRVLARDRIVLLVSGTNGKTTTTALLAAALRQRTGVASNDTGANMADGLVSVLASSSEPVVVAEVDELHLPAAVASTRPLVVVLLNLTRDQLDRAGEVHAVVRALRAMAEGVAASAQPWLVANCDDPNVAHVAGAFAKVVWVAGGATVDPAGGACPRCAASLHRDDPAWHCDGCGLTRPRPEWRYGTGELCDEREQFLGLPLVSPSGEVVPVRLGVPGAYNYGNASLAVAAAALAGVSVDRSVPAVSRVTDVAGRYRIFSDGPHRIQLLLAKNPAGWAAILQMLRGLDGAVLLALHAGEPDGCDTSWIYDVAFEELSGRQVVVCGQRAVDLATCLGYRGVEHTVFPQAPALTDLLRCLGPGPVYAIADYTSFGRLRRVLERQLTPVAASTPAQDPVSGSDRAR